MAEMFYDDGSKDVQFNGGSHAFCFVDDDHIVLTHHAKDGHYGIVGGGREQAETIEQTLVREVREEINGQMLKYGKVFAIHSLRTDDPNYDTWSFQSWANVKLFGEDQKIVDPDGDVFARVIVPISEVPKLLGWSDLGDRLEIVLAARAAAR